MQQTQKYKLNLIERDDIFSPDALNENTQKVEEVLSGQLGTMDTRTDTLDTRVTALEARKIAWGTYTGDGVSSKRIQLGFTPAVLFVGRLTTGAYQGFVVGPDLVLRGPNSQSLAQITEGGFKVWFSEEAVNFNMKGGTYIYLVLA